MILLPRSDAKQDTVPRRILINQDSTKAKNDSLSHDIYSHQKDTLKHKSTIFRQIIQPVQTDTTSVCERNSIADVTFYDMNNFIRRIGYGSYRQFPYNFTEKVKQQQKEDRVVLIKHLKPGIELPSHPLHTDWMVLIIIVAALLYSLVINTSRNLSHGFARFFLFRGINDPVSRDLGGLFHWQSTILNLISFLILGLFGYSAGSYYKLIPAGFKGIIIWLIVLGIISVGVTLRHITCVITGEASEEREVFRQYLLAVYQSYRFGALFHFCHYCSYVIYQTLSCK